MKRVIILFLALAPFIANSQRFEAGLFAGVTGYQGDLSYELYDASQLKEAYGGFARLYFSDHINLRLNLAGGRMSGSDASTPQRADGYEGRIQRNLSFRSGYYEIGLMPEINLLGFDPYNLDRIISPYIFGGISFMGFNPKANYQDEWIELQPLGTEGQGMAGYNNPYKKTSWAIPMGAGIKFAVNDLWNVGLEVNSRMTFTDYLDDVGGFYVPHSELVAGNGALAATLADRSAEITGEPRELPEGTRRGNPDSTDWFTTIAITFSYNFLDNGLVGWRSKNRRGKNGCPTNF